jgi:hypothetical protein
MPSIAHFGSGIFGPLDLVGKFEWTEAFGVPGLA